MSDNENLATVKIFKFNPAVDREPRYETHQVPYDGRTVLNVLETIYQGFDKDLAFRFGCEGKGDSRCGACAMQVNGVPAFACRKEAEKEMVIDPHPKFEIVKDLMVDFNKVKKEVLEQTPRVKIRIDSDRCVKCADCASICSVSVYNLLPSPCRSACPIDTKVLDYISLIAQEKHQETIEMIREVNPFPGVTGRVCTHPCEEECRRGEIDQPIAICALKRFAADGEQNADRPEPVILEGSGEKVAVVGSGPAGLMAAHDLARLGHQVTVFESLPVAGGMLRAGIPAYRLPREVLEAEIRRIEELGVEFRMNTEIGKDMTIDAVFERDYRSILLACGAHQGIKMQIPGEDSFEGMLDALTFLRGVNQGTGKATAARAIVVGGGNAAVDSARTLLRQGGKEVSIIYRRSKKEMPAIESEVEEAQREGVVIYDLVAPNKVLGKNGRVIGLECLRTELGEPDSGGRPRPLPIKGSEFSLEADLIISAIGQKPDLSCRAGYNGPNVSEEGTLIVDPDTMATNIDGMFAAGDLATGPNTVVHALAGGRRAAISIHRYLGKEGEREGNLKKRAAAKEEKRIWWREVPGSERVNMSKLSVDGRSLNFNEVELGLSPEQAVAEAKRCLGCAVFANIDEGSCLGSTCGQCVTYCWKNAIAVEVI